MPSAARAIPILLAALLLVAAARPAAAEPADDVDAFLAAVTRGDVEAALARLDEAAVYEGLLICPPGACVGRASIGAALSAEVDDGSAFDLWIDAAEETPIAVSAGGRMRCRSLAPRRLTFTLQAEVGPRGITALRLAPDRRDPETRRVLDALAAVQAMLDEARALGFAGPIVVGGSPP